MRATNHIISQPFVIIQCWDYIHSQSAYIAIQWIGYFELLLYTPYTSIRTSTRTNHSHTHARTCIRAIGNQQQNKNNNKILAKIPEITKNKITRKETKSKILYVLFSHMQYWTMILSILVFIDNAVCFRWIRFEWIFSSLFYFHRNFVCCLSLSVLGSILAVLPTVDALTDFAPTKKNQLKISTFIGLKHTHYVYTISPCPIFQKNTDFICPDIKGAHI